MYEDLEQMEIREGHAELPAVDDLPIVPAHLLSKLAEALEQLLLCDTGIGVDGRVTWSERELRLDLGERPAEAEQKTESSGRTGGRLLLLLLGQRRER